MPGDTFLYSAGCLVNMKGRSFPSNGVYGLENTMKKNSSALLLIMKKRLQKRSVGTITMSSCYSSYN